MVEVVLAFAFMLCCSFAAEVFVDVCWQCCYGPSSNFVTFRNKVCLHSFVCWQVYISPQNMSEQAQPALKDVYSDRFFIAFSYRDLFVIFNGYLILGISLSSYRWNESGLASSVRVRVHVGLPQLYVKIDFIAAL